jgi:hypothetical protein
VLYAAKDDTVIDVYWLISHHLRRNIDLVACERVQSYGIAGASLLRTAEVYGGIQRTAEVAGLPFAGIYRRDVCSALHVKGKGRDQQVRQRMIELHGGSKAEAIGTKRAPGPLYGVTSHAWQALGLAVVARERALFDLGGTDDG